MSSSPPRAVIAAGPLRAGQGVVAVVDRSGVTVGEAAATRGGDLRLTSSTHVPFGGDGDGDDRHLGADAIAEALAEGLRAGGLGRTVAVLAVADDLFGATLGRWASGLDRAAEEALVARRVREVVESSDVTLTADRRDAGVGEDGEPRAYFVWASEPFSRALDRACAERRLVVEQLVPRSLALLDLFGGTRAEGDDVELFVGVAVPHLVIGVYHGRSPVYVRFLRHVLASDDAESRLHATLSEIRRTIAFFKENHRGRGVDAIVPHGDGADTIEQMVPAILGSVATRRLGGDEVEGPDALLLALMHMRVAGGRRTSLLPPRPVAARRRVASAAAVLLGVCAWVGHLLVLEAEGVAAARTQVAGLDRRVASEQSDWARRAAELDEVRRDAAAARTLAAAGVEGPDVVAALLDASASLPTSAALHDVALSSPYGEGAGAPSARLGVVTRAAEVAALDAYVARIGERPWCLAVAASDDRAALAARRRLQDPDEQVTASVEFALR